MHLCTEIKPRPGHKGLGPSSYCFKSSDMYYPQIDQDIEVDICQTRSVKEKNRLEKIKQDTKMGFMTTKLL